METIELTPDTFVTIRYAAQFLGIGYTGAWKAVMGRNRIEHISMRRTGKKGAVRVRYGSLVEYKKSLAKASS